MAIAALELFVLNHFEIDRPDCYVAITEQYRHLHYYLDRSNDDCSFGYTYMTFICLQDKWRLNNTSVKTAPFRSGKDERFTESYQ